MALNPRKLKPAEAVRLLNATPLGEVITPHVVTRHLNRAAYKIGDGKRIDIVRYAAWLFQSQHSAFAKTQSDGYERHKEAANARSRAQSLKSRDIAGEAKEWIHPPIDSDRRNAASECFRAFCDSYFPQTFHLPWSPDHLKVMKKIEAAVLDGGLFAMAMPRGSGKTSLCEVACIWSLLYGHREFVALIGSDEDHAANMLESIKSELENNDLLEEDFSEVCGPIRALEGIHQRAGGQLYRGARTHVGWTAKEIVLPSVDGSAASGAAVRVAGITGRIRGMKYKRPDGRTIRPSLVLIDDPQTDESARSPSQCIVREGVLSGAILGLAGPGRKIAGLMTLTVVRPDDMADRILNRDENPQWQGERTKMVYAFPTNEKLWEEYAKLRANGQRSGEGLTVANEFYVANREAMDAGAITAWPERHNPDELSALHHAMNLKLDQGDNSFFAEYQNEPRDPFDYSEILKPGEIVDRINRIPRGTVPDGHNVLTAFVDVQGEALFWSVVGFAEDMTAAVIDYGVYPDQSDPHAYFTLQDMRRKLSDVHPAPRVAGDNSKAGFGGPIYAGLEVLTATKLLGKEYLREDGIPLRVQKQFIDIGWDQSGSAVADFCRRSTWAANLSPSKGVGIGATSTPMSEYKRDITKHGDHWCNGFTTINRTRKVQTVMFDTNYWKSTMHKALSTPLGNRCTMTLFGDDPKAHRMIADHLTAEYTLPVSARGRTVSEWRLKPAKPDNHWFDCVIGCFVAASCVGVATPGVPNTPPARRVIVVPPKPGERVIHRAKRVA